MTDRPAFDPSVYETPELAEINRPLHSLGWDMIEAERALTELTKARAGRAEWDAQFEIVTKARAAHAAALEIVDAEVDAYCERAEAAAATAATAGPVYYDDQPSLI